MTSAEFTRPDPGSTEARAQGCTCPVLDNAHGRGWMGGVKDENGDTIFVYTAGCPVHVAIFKAREGRDG